MNLNMRSFVVRLENFPKKILSAPDSLRVILIAVASTVLGLAACGGPNTGNVSSISISPASANVGIGTQEEFTATVSLQNSTVTTNTAVTWEVNAVAGGNATTGTIVASTTNPDVGIYTAPATVPGVNNGQVNITAVSSGNNTTTTTSSGTTSTITSSGAVVTSNTAVVTITAAGLVGLAVTPATVTVPAGGTQQFSATQNSVADTHALWSVSSANGGNIGTINSQTGVYTAPLYPPPGGMVTVTATDGTNSSTSTVTVAYSDHTLSGPYAFSYQGNDASGFRAVAGSFNADGNGNITEGVEDIESSLTGISTEVSITGTYIVGNDGRTTVTLNSGLQTASTLRFALTTNQHGVLTRFNSANTGNGSVDQQNLNAIEGNPPSAISGPYVFSVFGTDASFNALGMAGGFFSSGNGTIAASSNSILDVNDDGTVTREDRTISGSYTFDATFPGTGRGTITLTSTTTGSRQYAFYIIDGTRMHLVEIDHNAFTSGHAFSSPTGSSFSAANFASGNYVFTTGGMAGSSAHTYGGVFTSNGSGSVTGGTLDSNAAGGTAKLNTSLTSCGYSVDSTTGRVDVSLCSSGASNLEFAAYPTTLGTDVLLELDSSALTSGLAYSQQAATSTFQGNFAFNLGGQGVFHNAQSSYPPDTEGQLTLSGTAASAGNLDINTFANVFANDTVNATSTTISAPSTTGRGTFLLIGTNPAVTYNLIYYVISGNSALLFDQDTTRLANGIIAQQF